MSEFVYVNTLCLTVLGSGTAVTLNCVTRCSWRSDLLPIVDPCGREGDEIPLLAGFERLVRYCVQRTRVRCSSAWLAVKVRQKLDKSLFAACAPCCCRTVLLLLHVDPTVRLFTWHSDQIYFMRRLVVQKAGRAFVVLQFGNVWRGSLYVIFRGIRKSVKSGY